MRLGKDHGVVDHLLPHRQDATWPQALKLVSSQCERKAQQESQEKSRTCLL